MNDTEDLRLLRQMHSGGKLNDKEYTDAKALLLNFGLSIAEELQLFQQMYATGELTDRELATAQTMLLILPKDSDKPRIVRSDSIDSAYDQRQLHRESILEQLDRGWEAARPGRDGKEGAKFSIGCGMAALIMSALILFFAIRALSWERGDLFGVGIGSFVLISGFVFVLIGIKEARDYRVSLALYTRLRAVLANRADIPVRIPA